MLHLLIATSNRSLFIGLTFLLFLFSPCGASADSPKPNILLVLIDDLGWKDIACQGNPHLHTPHVDSFADQGMRFTDAYAASPVCSPTRAAILTGLSPARLHITNHLPHQDRFTPDDAKVLPAEMLDHLPLEHTTIAERLKNDAGYATAFIGKWHLYKRKDHQFGPLAQGFDINIGGCSFGGPPTFFDPYKIDNLENRKEGEYLPDRLADETIAFMRTQVKAEKPFFVALFNYTVHWPMEAPESLVEKYKDRPMEGYNHKVYPAMIEAMDTAFGKTMAALDELGVAEDTLVIFTSDNGAYGGVGDMSPLRESKGHLFEGGIRVPFIARWTGKIEPGTESDVPVISTDLFPTLLEAAGLEPDPETPADGESLLPLFKGEAAPDRDALFWHYPNYAFHKSNRLGSAIRIGDHKLIYRYDDGSLELYNLKDDIGESKNLAAEKPELASKMQKRLSEWLKDSEANLPRPR